MSRGIDSAIDDLIEAASLLEARRAFEVDVCRRRLDGEIDKAMQRAAHEAMLYGCDCEEGVDP